MILSNWSGNLVYSTQKLHEPQTIEALQQLIKENQQIKVLGSRHSFNTIADSSDILVSLGQLNPQITIDETNKTVTAHAGIRYGELASYLHQHGYALHNLASLPHISVVGACATATHGSGVNNGNLATAVSAIEFINGNGDIITVKRGEPDFDGAVINLGAIGIVIKITLDIEPTYNVRQTVFTDIPISSVYDNFIDIMSVGYSVSLFTQWQSGVIEQAWVKNRAGETPPTNFYDGHIATRHFHPIADVSSNNSTPQMGILGAWHERLPHFRMEFTPSNGEELQSEYFVSREYAVPAIKAIRGISDIMGEQLLISEIRCIASDELWLSPCYQKDCVAFHFTWKRNASEVQAILTQLESVLLPFNPLPHWGKLYTMSPEVVQAGYSKFSDFKNLVTKYDPNGKFSNTFLKTNILS